MKARIEAPIPDQLNPVLVLQILGKGTLLTRSPGQLTSNVITSRMVEAEQTKTAPLMQRRENRLGGVGAPAPQTLIPLLVFLHPRVGFERRVE
jgi:hypothetical protein